jgi:hypothetical protein
MKKILAMCGVLLAMSAPAFAANEGLSLTWGECALETNDQNLDWTNCQTGTIPSQIARLYCTLKSNVALPNFIAVQNVFDLQEENPSLSAFYRFDAVCNAAGISSRIDGPCDQFTCQSEGNPWGSACTEASTFIVLTTPSGNRNRIIIAHNRDASSPFPINPKTNYYFGHILFSVAQRGNCAGCVNRVAIVWNDSELAENTGNRYRITRPSPDKDTNCATINGAVPGTCAATPAKKTTWGQLKSIYR